MAARCTMFLLLSVFFFFDTTTTSLAGEPQSSLLTSNSVKVLANPDPRGSPGMQPCATTDAELEEFYKECMEPDFANWRTPKTPLGLDKVRRFIQMYITTPWFSPQSFCLLHNNTWYYPFHRDWDGRVHDGAGPQVTLWITASASCLRNYTDAGRIGDWPNSFFFFSDQDTAHCYHPDRCPIPALSITRNTAQDSTDLLLPFFVNVEHPLWDYPWQLKEDKLFFRGNPNWGASTHVFDGKLLYSRQHFANLTHYSNDSRLDMSLICPHFSLPNVTARPAVDLVDHAKYKYVVNLDGVSYSLRLSRIMHTNSVLVKEETPWIEYFVRAMKEGVHYLPILKKGPYDVFELLDTWKGRDLELIRMAYNSQQFALKFLCPHARLLYLRRLLREYNKLIPDMESFITNEILPLLQLRASGKITNLTVLHEFVIAHDVSMPYNWNALVL